MVIACSCCNSEKSNLLPEQYYQRELFRGNIKKAAKIFSLIERIAPFRDEITRKHHPVVRVEYNPKPKLDLQPEDYRGDGEKISSFIKKVYVVDYVPGRVQSAIEFLESTRKHVSLLEKVKANIKPPEFNFHESE